MDSRLITSNFCNIPNFPAPLSSYTYLVTFQLWKHPAVTFPGPHLGCGMLAETMTEWQQMLIPWTVTTSLLNPQLCPAISLITQLCLHFPYRFLKHFPNYLKPLMALPLPSFSANDLSPSSTTRSGRSLPSALHTIPIHSSFPPCSWMSFFPTHCSEDSPLYHQPSSTPPAASHLHLYNLCLF